MKAMFFNNLPLALSILTTLAIASTEVPLWASAFSLLFIFWRFLYERLGIYKLSPKLTPVFGLMFFVVVYIQHRTIFGQEESITILVGLTAITILNFATERDLLFLVLLGFLMMVLKSVFSLDFIWVLPALVSYFGLWMTLISNSKVNKTKYVLRTTLRSVPVLVILFVFFPRFVLFQVNKVMNSPTVQSGFNEEMSPGRFSHLALNDEMVFRAQFTNTESIDSEKLYWRGAVLNISDGFNWKKGIIEKKNLAFEQLQRSSGIKYKAIIEPSNVRNVFLLDHFLRVKNASVPLVEWSNSQFTLADKPSQIVQIEAEADFDDAPEVKIGESNQSKYLQIAELTPRAKNWVDQTKEKFSNLEERLRALIAFFEKPGFIYTLRPDIYENNLDMFLFVKKKGYCEHYAAAFATLARALEIPSRVVIGYQGGSYNAISDFWKISQRDAHAWVEVGLNNQWRRVDPTAFVSPLRLSLGSQDFFSLSEVDQMLFSKDKKWKKSNWFRKIYLIGMSLFDSFNYNWTLFLLTYDLQAQLDILKSIKVSWFFMIFAAFVFLLFLSYIIKKRRPKVKPKHELFELINAIELWANEQQLQFSNLKPPLQNLRELSIKHPEFSSFLTRFSDEYEKLVYQERSQLSDFVHFKKEWQILIKNRKNKV